MLNTQSKLAVAEISLAVACIVLQLAWTLFSWPPLHVMSAPRDVGCVPPPAASDLEIRLGLAGDTLPPSRLLSAA